MGRGAKVMLLQQRKRAPLCNTGTSADTPGNTREPQDKVYLAPSKRNTRPAPRHRCGRSTGAVRSLLLQHDGAFLSSKMWTVVSWYTLSTVLSQSGSLTGERIGMRQSWWLI
ncbi:hypothetical protein HYPSUDRAFT_40634 [Hypholoma sublateritium FD-334 SS-4]|uniref:Uncharacterized protein n=1 Tax=Hypholoma sublateritium (strain FD-334 SS-4) TaxID=945553 RepID=A0A0D2NVI8_HYPSF|nr:hypothetical protein HYPSUDRAFT_40634 [Hypholoma sublateritium FD-334 SS-4]